MALSLTPLAVNQISVGSRALAAVVGRVVTEEIALAFLVLGLSLLAVVFSPHSRLSPAHLAASGGREGVRLLH